MKKKKNSLLIMVGQLITFDVLNWKKFAFLNGMVVFYWIVQDIHGKTVFSIIISSRDAMPTWINYQIAARGGSFSYVAMRT